MQMLDRRLFLGTASAAALVPAQLVAAPANGFVMWHSPGCGCCLEWAKRMEASFKRKLPVVETGDIQRVKRAQGVPQDLQSCHTALVHGYAIEGHVPPADIQRLIRSKSRIIRGLAVPGMPAGSPGMDVGHGRRDPYKVYAFAPNGRSTVFATHG
nr:DUF411 domain-containing protein [uncultured Sphingosinicella sp.]